jgi:ribosomal protein S18 acetylase RimI-like enzyme
MLEKELFASGPRFVVKTHDKDGSASNIGVPVISLDPVFPSDEPLLYQTYAGTRTEEMALTGWSAEQQETFLRMQYEAQRRSYRMQFPDAEYWVIRCDEVAVGRLIVDRTPEEIHVMDIALLPEFRAQGIGSTVMEAIMNEALQAEKTVRLHVERFNPALRWYERLGFGVVSAGPIYLEMVWRPSRPSCNSSQPASGSGPDVQDTSLGAGLCRSI